MLGCARFSTISADIVNYCTKMTYAIVKNDVAFVNRASERKGEDAYGACGDVPSATYRRAESAAYGKRHDAVRIGAGPHEQRRSNR